MKQGEAFALVDCPAPMSLEEGDILGRIPHRPPWLLIDRVLGIEGGEVRAEKQLTSGDPLLANGDLAEVFVLEALAQTAACLLGKNERNHRGYLVGASKFQFAGRAAAGQTLTLRALRTATLGALHRFDGEAAVEGRVIARGEMTFAVADGRSDPHESR